ncbi:MAG TPA: anthranilate synthase component I family protein [Methylomirabilota bacterium]|nr:anthranilate synthase component I family protein [Methylomirabilota bacterium]
MRPVIQEVSATASPEALVQRLHGERGVMLLRSAAFDSPHARHSFVVARPFLRFTSAGSRCEIASRDGTHEQFGNPWHLLDVLMSRCELLEELDLPFPLGGCFGYWGYDLKNFVEPKLTRNAVNDLELPDCCVGFYSSLVVFDHRLDKAWIVSTGLDADGSRDEQRAKIELDFWREKLGALDPVPPLSPERAGMRQTARTDSVKAPEITSNLTREQFISAVERAQHYIQHGHIYQVNLSHRLSCECELSGWQLFERLGEISPAPFAAYFDCGHFQLASSSPELFLRLSGRHIVTRPIKGTRPRSTDATRDAQLSYELQTSAKEMSELVMITDLLRNDLGRVCEFGSVQVPELVRLERYAHVQHLVSTVEGRLRNGVTHFHAFASCFPGGSVTGAPKIRAMEIIDELEPITRGPYTGALGYLGFNRESQLGIVIRTAIVKGGRAYFHVGAGIVADSSPAAEYDETVAKACGFLGAVKERKRTGIARNP